MPYDEKLPLSATDWNLEDETITSSDDDDDDDGSDDDELEQSAAPVPKKRPLDPNLEESDEEDEEVKRKSPGEKDGEEDEEDYQKLLMMDPNLEQEEDEKMDTSSGDENSLEEDEIDEIKDMKQRLFEEDTLMYPEVVKYYSVKVHNYLRHKTGLKFLDIVIKFKSEDEELLQMEIHEILEVISKILFNLCLAMRLEAKDKFRFVLISKKLDRPISIPFISMSNSEAIKLLTDAIGNCLTSHQSFTLNGTRIHIVHVPLNRIEGGHNANILRRKYGEIDKYLRKSKSIYQISNTDGRCLLYALFCGLSIEKYGIGKKVNYKRKSLAAIKNILCEIPGFSLPFTLSHIDMILNNIPDFKNCSVYVINLNDNLLI